MMCPCFAPVAHAVSPGVWLKNFSQYRLDKLKVSKSSDAGVIRRWEVVRDGGAFCLQSVCFLATYLAIPLSYILMAKVIKLHPRMSALIDSSSFSKVCFGITLLVSEGMLGVIWLGNYFSLDEMVVDRAKYIKEKEQKSAELPRDPRTVAKRSRIRACVGTCVFFSMMTLIVTLCVAMGVIVAGLCVHFLSRWSYLSRFSPSVQTAVITTGALLSLVSGVLIPVILLKEECCPKTAKQEKTDDPKKEVAAYPNE